ncbi:hypothetical protein FKM82_000956 [Ascaphus truei]
MCFFKKKLLLLFIYSGMVIPGGKRCLCRQLSKKINPRLVEKIEIFQGSSYCENIEVVATLKGSKKTKCLNPALKVVQDLISAKNQRIKKKPVVTNVRIA